MVVAVLEGVPDGVPDLEGVPDGVLVGVGDLDPVIVVVLERVAVPEGVIDGYLIALKELEEKKIPFIIRRLLPNRGSEYWHLEDLQIIN